MGQRVKIAFRRYFFAGILVLIPGVITVIIIYWLVDWIAELLKFGIIPSIINHLVHFPKEPSWLYKLWQIGLGTVDFLLGLILVLGIILITGSLARTYFLKRIINWGEQILVKIPLAGIIYKASRQLLNSLLDNKDQKFNRVVLVEYPVKNCWSIGLVSRESAEMFNQATGEKMVNIFIPTTPNPTNGFLIMMPEKSVRELNLTVDQAFQVIISGGISMPDKIKEVKPGGGDEV